MANKGKWRESRGRFVMIALGLLMIVSLSACADDYYGNYPRYGNGYYAAANGPYYGPYANRPIGYGAPLYSVYPYNNYPYGYGPYGYGYGAPYGSGVNVSIGGGGYYRNGYYYDRAGRRISRAKRVRRQQQRASRNYQNDQNSAAPVYPH